MNLYRLPYYGHLKLLLRYRVLLLAIIVGLVLYGATTIKEGFVYSDKELWLNGSKEYGKLLKLKYPSLHVEKVLVDISKDGWSAKAVGKLKTLQHAFLEKEGVVGVNSLFEQQSLIDNTLSEEESMMEIVTLMDESDEEVFYTVDDSPDKFSSFFDGDQVVFYLLSDRALEGLSSIESPYPMDVLVTEKDSHIKDFVIFAILFVILVAALSLGFRSALPSIIGTTFIAATTTSTVALYQMLSAVDVTHISIVILSVTVSVMDFIYIYYKWHILQRRLTGTIVLYRTIAKTFVPIFWTTLISIVGIGSLVLVDSHVLYSMGMNVALSSTVGFVLSFTFLPLMLSFFKQKDPQIATYEGARYFAQKEAAYHTNGLQLFLITTFVVFIFSFYNFITEPINAVVSDTDTNQIHVVLIEPGMSAETMLELQNIQNLLKGEFDSIDRFESAYEEIKRLYLQEHPAEHFDLSTVDLDSYMFMFDLYDITKNVLVNDHLKLTIYLNGIQDKQKVLQFLRDEDILIQDLSSLLDIAKTDSIKTLFLVVIFVLTLIVTVIYYITRSLEFSRIAFVVNSIPLVWFFTAVILFDIALSTDMLVAMIITVALSSDATLHFIFYYHNNRHKPRSATTALESSFVYVGIALGMGNVMLATTFAALIFIPDPTISNIGLFSSVLVLLSLAVDLFILPVLFLNRIRNNMAVEGYYHGVRGR